MICLYLRNVIKKNILLLFFYLTKEHDSFSPSLFSVRFNKEIRKYEIISKLPAMPETLLIEKLLSEKIFNKFRQFKSPFKYLWNYLLESLRCKKYDNALDGQIIEISLDLENYEISLMIQLKCLIYITRPYSSYFCSSHILLFFISCFIYLFSNICFFKSNSINWCKLGRL